MKAINKLSYIKKAVDEGKDVFSDFGRYSVIKQDGSYYIKTRTKLLDLCDQNNKLNGAGFVIGKPKPKNMFERVKITPELEQFLRGKRALTKFRKNAVNCVDFDVSEIHLNISGAFYFKQSEADYWFDLNKEYFENNSK